MSRPRTIKLEQGEVSLSGFPKEVADALTMTIKDFESGVSSLKRGEPTVLDAEDIEPDSDETPLSIESLPHRAVGIYHQDGLHRVITVAYNLDSKQALVVDVKGAIDAKDASTQFKMAADKLRFV